MRGRLFPAAWKAGRWGTRHTVRLRPDQIWFEGWVGKAERRGTGKKRWKETCIENLLVPDNVTLFHLILTMQLFHK